MTDTELTVMMHLESLLWSQHAASWMLAWLTQAIMGASIVFTSTLLRTVSVVQNFSRQQRQQQQSPERTPYVAHIPNLAQLRCGCTHWDEPSLLRCGLTCVVNPPSMKALRDHKLWRVNPISLSLTRSGAKKRPTKPKSRTNSTKEFFEQFAGVAGHYPVKQGF